MTRAALRKASRHVSASQISTYRDCPRKWAFKHVDGISEPPNKYAKAGLDMHEVLAAYLSRGVNLNLSTRAGEMAFAGVKHLPPPSPELRVEHEARFEFEGVEYLGYLDLHYAEQVHCTCGITDGFVGPTPPGRHHNRKCPLFLDVGSDGVAVATEIAAERQIVVVDHKSSSNIDKWAKTEAELVKDPQRILYSWWAVRMYGARRVRARWVYYSSRPPYRSRVVEIVQTREEIWQHLQDVHVTAKEIVRARDRPSSEAERNFHACHAYGGCPFIERCHAGTSSIDRMASIFAQMDRAERAREEPVSTPAPASAMVLPPREREPLHVLAADGTPLLLEQQPQPQGRTMNTLEKLRAKEQARTGVAAPAPTEAPAKRPGMDPAPVREAYERAEATPPAPLAVVPQQDDPTPLPEGVEEQLAVGEGLENIMQTTDAPEPKGKRGAAKANVLRISIADEATGRLVLHAIGLLKGCSMADVEAHIKSLYG